MATTSTDELTAYPIVQAEALTVDPLYRELQQQGPIKVQFPFGEPCWLATRYDDVRMVYGDRRFGRQLGLTHDMPGIFSNEKVKDPTLLLNLDPPEQTRLRRLASGAFSPRRIGALTAEIQRYVDDLWDGVEAHGPGADFMALFSSRLPFLVMSRILGVPVDEAEQFAAWIDQLVGIDIPLETKAEAYHQLSGFIDRLIATRRKRRTDDLLSALVEARDDGDQLSEGELHSLCLAIWLGGYDTTHYELGSMVFALMTHPDRWQELVDDPSLMPAALEELWRWVPSHKYGTSFPRWASEDVELSFGTVIRAGEPVYPEQTVANRDESVFPHGWEIDFHRMNPQPHLTFTHGPHYCMGAHLAQLEMRLVLTTMVQRFPALELAVPADEIQWSPTSFLRGAEALPLRW